MLEKHNPYQVLFQNMVQGAFFQEKNGKLVDVNPAALELFGLTQDQFLGKTSLHPDWRVIKEDGSALPPEQHPSMVALKTGKEVRDFVAGVFNPVRKCFVWLSINAIPMFEEEEKFPYQVFVTLHDISAQLQTKKLYQARLKLLEFTENNTSEELLIFTLDEVEKLTESQISFYHFYNADTQDITLSAWSTRTSEQFCNVPEMEGHYPLVQAGVWVDCVREDRAVIHNDYESLPHRKGLPEGHAPIVRELVVPVKRKGEIVAILGVGNKQGDYTEADVETVLLFADLAWDIYNRKQAEHAFEQNKELLEKAQELGHIGTWQYVISENDLTWTDENCRIFAVPPGTRASYELFMQKVHPEDRNYVNLEWTAAMQGKPYDIEHRLLIDGETRWVREKADLKFDGQGNALSAIGYTQDITDRKRAEALRIQTKEQNTIEKSKLTEQLQQFRKIEAVGRLAGGVAHDYNNMLGVIIGNTELATMKAGPDSPLHKYLEQTMQAAIRSRDITQQLLAFARKQVIKPEVLDLNAAMKGMLNMLGRLLGENIELDWHPKDNLWPVEIDPSQLDQILANLCINARDAIDSTGTLTIKTDMQTLTQDYCDKHPGFVPGEYVTLKVMDDGQGMNEETRQHIFEPFYTTKAVGEGTGLGLAMVYGVVKQSNGFINVFSESGKGTTFKIYLPRYRGAEGIEQASTITEVSHGQGETVLLVEDEKTIVELATSMLEELGYKVLAADTPTEALTLAESYQGAIQLLLTDVVMPKMNGRELADQIKAFYPEIKCLFMSGYSADVIAHHGVLDEGVHFIQKPFSISALSTRIRDALG